MHLGSLSRQIVACCVAALSIQGSQTQGSQIQDSQIQDSTIQDSTIQASKIQASQIQASPPVFRSGVQTVAIYATVNDREGRLVPDLSREAFTILDNGQSTPVTLFSNDIQPITVVMLLDMSGSMNARFLKVRDGTIGFINALLPADRVRLGSFGTEIALSPLLTGDKATLERICKEEMWPGGGTPMWNAVFAGMKSLTGEPGM